MSINDLDQRCARLRQKLKEWETAFAATHDGHKPSREDVKREPNIAQRYKDYNKLRSKLSHPQQPPQDSSSQRKRQRPSTDEPSITVKTPSKRQKPLPDSHPSVLDPYDPPISFLLSPSQQRPFIGPTPQKDGQVLGIFDGLSTHSIGRTPSRRVALESREANVQATPSKKPTSKPGSASQSGRNSGQGVGMLDVKLTPSIQRITNKCTPGSRNSVRKLRFDDTPVFLRRDSQRGITPKKSETLEEDISWSPIAVRKPQKLAGRSLSAIVRGLRDMEDEHLDEELELMREMEGGDAPSSKPPLKPPNIQVEDSQQVDMPLGPDRGQESDDELQYMNEGKGRDGRPLKVWKKKGQKRTTRRTNMRPNTAKWEPEQKWKGAQSEGDDAVGADMETCVGLPKAKAAGCEKQGGDEVEDGMDESEDEEEVRKPKKSKAGEAKVGEEKKSGPSTKVKRKISATAHANFRALKIKNKNSKAKGRGRFGRR